VLALFVCVVAVSAAPAVSSKKAFLEPKTNDVVVSLMSDLAGVHGKDDGKEAAESEEAKAGAEEDAEQESEEDAEQEAEEDAEQQAEQEAEGAEEDPVSLIDAREAAEEEEEEEANAGAEEDDQPTYVLREHEAEQDEEDEEQDEEEKAVRQSPSSLQRRRAVRSTVRRRRRTVAISTAKNGVGVRRRRTVATSSYSWTRAARAELEQSEDAAIQKIRLHMENGHKLQQQQLKISQDRYDRITTKRYACTDAGVRAELKKIIASQRRIGQQGLNKKQHQETQLFLKRQRCMKKFSGDQSKKKSPRVEYCMSTVSAQEKAPVAQDQGLTLYEKVAVKKQTDHFQQMLDHAMKASLADLVNSVHIWDEYSRVCSVFSDNEQKQMQDTWEEDNKKYLKQCKQSTPP